MASKKRGKKTMEPKKTVRAPNKIVILMVFIAIAAIMAGLLILLPDKRLRILTVGLDDRESAAIESTLAAEVQANQIAKNSYVILSGKLSSHSEIVIARSGAAFKESSNSFKPIPGNIYSRIPSPLRAPFSKGKSVWAAPILMDYFEIAWHKDRFSGADLESPLTLPRFKTAVADFRDPIIPAILFAGGDDETLFLVLSALCCSTGGIQAYQEALVELGSGLAIKDLPLGESPLRAAITELQGWNDDGRLHPEWYRLKPQDVRKLVENELAFIVLQLLSDHRLIAYDSISRFESGTFPGRDEASGNVVVAPMLVVGVQGKAARLAEALDVLDKLTGVQNAFGMATKAGRTSTIAAGRMPDIQASKALASAAGAAMVVSGLYRDAFVDPGKAHEAAEAIRGIIRR